MPTTQKLQQKQTKATQKVGGSAKKPVTKAMEGGSAAPSKGKMTRGGSAKGGGYGINTANLFPGTKKEITNLRTEINKLTTEVTNIKSNIEKINIETLNKVQFDIKAIIDAMDDHTRNKIYVQQEKNVKEQIKRNESNSITFENGMPISIYDEMYPHIYVGRW